jgi:hypothetical protein
LNITTLSGARAAAFGCVCILALTVSACGSEERPKAIVRPSDDPTAMDMYPDGGVLSPSERCVVSPDYLLDRKACNTAADCEQFTFVPVCCMEVHVVGVARDRLAEVQTCASDNDNVCACAPSLKRAEDGRVVTNESPAALACIENQCVTRIAERSCGATKRCRADEICVVYDNVPGGIPPDPDSQDNAYLTFKCEPNPCGDRLDCDCALQLCKARNDAERTCQIKNVDNADLNCKPYLD